jgi:multiple sugar transport system substrate-binding protein
MASRVGDRSTRDGGSIVDRGLIRRLVALTAMVLVATACGGATATPTGSSAGVPSASAAAPSASVASGEPVELRWYCCLGTGEDPAQIPTEEAVAAAVTEAFPNITLKFEVVTYDAARDTLATQIASGNGPDIVGPVGVGGAEAFHGQWLDLGPLISETGYDLSEFDQGAVDFYKIGDVQEGIPFAIYPSMLWYKASLFEEAGLELPPHQYGAPYTMPDGSEVEWDYDTVRQLALMLTVDAEGRDATQAGFDPEQIVQYGFDPQRDDLRGMGAYFGAGALSPDGGTTVTIPDAWTDAWKYWYDGMHDSHFTMTQPVAESEDFSGGGYTFFSGRVAMSNNFLWTTYGVADAGDDWDLAAIPSHEGTTTSPLNADTFRILKDTKHPVEAFQALTYLLGEGSDELLQLYGGMPARTADQDAFFDTLGQTEGFPAEVDWQVARDSVQFADNPNFEAFMPKYNESLEVLTKYRTKWGSTAGLDMDAEIEALRAELQATWDQ